MKRGQTKEKSLLLLSLLLLSLILSSSAKAETSETSFSIIWLTDTQYLSEKYPSYFDAVCNWIAENSNLLNLKTVIHTGDILENAQNLVEWENANHSMSILLNSNIPYCWCAGNHEWPGSPWSWLNFTAFNTTALLEKNYWVSDKLDGRNTALIFSASEWSFLVVNIEYHANDTVLQWANNLIDTHPSFHVILGTHAYLNEKSGYDSWAIHLRNAVLANHSSVFMTLSGHFVDDGRFNRTLVDNRHELFFNYQGTDGGLNDSTIRIMTFIKDRGIIAVNTYNPITKQLFTDPDNQFNLKIPFYDNLNATVDEPVFVPFDPSNGAENEPAVMPELPSNLFALMALLPTILAAALMRKGILKKRSR
jgi:hypothetical protein